MKHSPLSILHSPFSILHLPFSILFLLLPLTLNAESTPQDTLTTWCAIQLRDGSSQTYAIRGNLTIIPSDTQLTIASPTLQTTYTLSQVRSYRFLNLSPDAPIPGSLSPGTLSPVTILFTSPDQLTIQGIPSNQTVRLFSTNGTQYPVDVLPSQDLSLTISLSALPTGVYLVTLPSTDIPPIKVVRK